MATCMTPDQVRANLKWIRLIVFGMGLMSLLASLPVILFGVYSAVKAGQSSGWVSAQGTVLESGIDADTRTGDTGTSTTYQAEILYEYTVNGKEHVGNRVSFGDYGSSDRLRAERIHRRYRVEDAVTVYYNPDDPDDAVLEPGFSRSSFMFIGFGAIFFVPGLLMMIGARYIRPRVDQAKGPDEDASPTFAVQIGNPGSGTSSDSSRDMERRGVGGDPTHE